MSSRTPGVKTGDIVEGRYRIIRTLGEGSMGVVFLAEEIGQRRRVALKVLRPRPPDDAGVDDFLREARAAGALGHPHIAGCTDAGFVRPGVPYLALEYLEGALLTDEIYRVGGLPIRRALAIARQIATALGAAHDAGLTHRDLKSDHVFLVDVDVDTVKVLDFGASRLLADGKRGLVSGAPEYLAPEQVTGGDGGVRADIYALGVILYEMLTARRPFSDDDRRALLHRVVHEPPPPLLRREAPPGLEELIATRLLAKDPARRFASMADVQAALEAFATARPGAPVSSELPIDVPVAPVAAPVPAPVEPVVEPVGPSVPRSRSARTGGLVAAVALGALGAVLAYVEDQAAAAADRAAAAALDNDAEKLASAIDGEVRAARLRAEGVATTPMLRAAIETDAATLKDMAGSDFIFSPRLGEVLELFQVRPAGAPVSMLRIPATAAPLPPLVGSQTRIDSDGARLTILVSAPIARQQAGIGGSVAIAQLLDVAQIERRLAEHARAATLVGFGRPIALVGSGAQLSDAAAQTVAVPLGSDLRAAEVSLTAVAAPSPYAVSGKLRTARIACWAVAAALLVLYLATLLRGRKRG